MATSASPSIVWFRKDLRLEDNPAFFNAVKKGPVVPVFLWSPNEEDYSTGSASKVWLYYSLLSLKKQLESYGLNLIIRKGESLKNLLEITASISAKVVYSNKRYEPSSIKKDQEVASKLKDIGLEYKTFNGNLIIDPEVVLNKSNLPFKVFSPFWKKCLSVAEPSKPLPIPNKIISIEKKIKSLEIRDLNLREKEQWALKINNYWDFNNGFAQKKINSFLENNFNGYCETRNFPSIDGTSKLSPYLHYGQISPNQIFYELSKSGHENWKSSQFLAEIGWREFGYYLMFHFPNTINEPLRNEFNKFPWIKNDLLFESWKKGITGYPLVDAGMRELWETGWMHNRVRMVVASFLVKHLLIDWRKGADWFWDTLVDADLASNTLGWQWSAGCGADSAPYFRIFNPTTQAEKFDSDGNYIRRWIPELKDFKTPNIFQPYKYKNELFFNTSYPDPIVDHSESRKRALLAYDEIRK